MPQIDAVAGFVLASLVVLLMPGPAVLYVVTRSLSQGARAGLWSVLGLAAGALLHVAATAAGLAAIMLASATAFGIVKVLGAAYLVYLGLSTIFGRRSRGRAQVLPERPTRRLVLDGIVISVFNPKIAVFFLAYLPQFVTPDPGRAGREILVLGLIYVALALVTDGAYALLAGRLAGAVRRPVLAGPLPRYLSGGIYLGLGVHTAMTGRRP